MDPVSRRTRLIAVFIAGTIESLGRETTLLAGFHAKRPARDQRDKNASSNPLLSVVTAVSAALRHLALAVDDRPVASKPRIVSLYVCLLAINGGTWTWAIVALSNRPTLLETALLAYVLGIRHAVDPDHIAAIANSRSELRIG